MATTCSKCGAEVNESAVFCQKCGHRIGGGGDEPDSPQAAVGPAATADSKPGPTTSGVTSGQTPAERMRSAVTGAQSPADDQEDHVWEGAFSAKAMIGNWILSGLAVVVIAAAAFYFLSFINGLYVTLAAVVLILGTIGARTLYRTMAVHYKLTTQRLIHRVGVLRRVTDRIEMIDIDDVTFEQGIFDRIFGVGNIKIVSSDETDPVLWMYVIPNVQTVAGQIDDIRRQERRRRGLHI